MSVSSSPGGYLICASPRSGSTLLCGLLRSTGIAGRPESYFRAPDEDVYADRWQLHRDGGAFDYRDYARAAVAAGSTGNGVFAARVMWGTLEELVGKLRATAGPAGSDAAVLRAAFGPLRYVHLERTDTVAQAVSWVRAEQTGFWQDGEDAQPGGEPRYDREPIAATIRTIDEHNRAWREWFTGQGIPPYPVRYEELTADISGVTRGILDFLGLQLPATQEITPLHRRQADEVNRDWIARYNAAAC